jgi:hypothetical protein
MTRCLLAAALLALAGLDAGAAEKAAPVPVTPDWAFARLEGPDRVVLETIRLRSEARKVVEKAVQDGKEVEVERVVVVSVPVQQRQVLDLKFVQAFTPDGKPVKPDEVRARLEKGAGVVLSPTPQPLAPAFRALLKDDALILVAPPGPPLRVGPPPRPPEKPEKKEP